MTEKELEAIIESVDLNEQYAESLGLWTDEVCFHDVLDHGLCVGCGRKIS